MSQPYRFPAVYVSHGGGPWPFMDLGPAKQAAMKPLADYLGALVLGLPQRPRAVLMVSAHWEEPVATVMTSPHPPMLYDYYNFPASTYALQWPAPGATDLAPRCSALLGRAGFDVRSDPNRGFDHGTFVPMMLAFRRRIFRWCSCRCCAGPRSVPASRPGRGARAAARRGRAAARQRQELSQHARFRAGVVVGAQQGVRRLAGRGGRQGSRDPAPKADRLGRRAAAREPVTRARSTCCRCT